MLAAEPVPDLALVLPPLLLVRAALAAVWLYEGLWCKLLGREPRQVQVVEAVPTFGRLGGRGFLRALGAVEVAIAVWVLSGMAPMACAAVQVGLLVCLNTGGLIWARRIIHDPGGMVVKNFSFLLLAWVAAAMAASAG